MIRFEHITKKYKSKIVLNDISFEIEKGKLVTLIGASGCGKTTTLKMINRLIKPSSGTIYIKDENIEEKDVIELRRNMGYVIQQTGLFPHMTIKENIELIPKFRKRDSNDISQKTYDLMNMVGLNPEEYLERYPTELSGGQQQRVGVARAFATDPDIILMDEPFSALDPITRLNLQEELVNLQSEFKKTIIFVTHDMDEAIRISDKICIMKDGEILQYDTPENILKYPNNEFVTEFVGKNRIWTAPEYIKSKDIMIDNPVTCTKSITIQIAVEKMRAYKVDSLMVIDKHSKELLGIIRAKKIRSKVDRTQEVATIMERDSISTSPEDSILDVLKIVDENDISFIPVLDDSRALLGLITKSSLITTLSEQFLEAEEVL